MKFKLTTVLLIAVTTRVFTRYVFPKILLFAIDALNKKLVELLPLNIVPSKKPHLYLIVDNDKQSAS